jgi:hypothetical protein
MGCASSSAAASRRHDLQRDAHALAGPGSLRERAEDVRTTNASAANDMDCFVRWDSDETREPVGFVYPAPTLTGEPVPRKAGVGEPWSARDHGA